ncbi:MAG: hypothetical protein ACKVT1_21095 [Dehalococcoidia bacterium]
MAVATVIDLDHRPRRPHADGYRPGEPSIVHQSPEVVGAGPVLPGFALDLARLSPNSTRSDHSDGSGRPEARAGG